MMKTAYQITAEVLIDLAKKMGASEDEDGQNNENNLNMQPKGRSRQDYYSSLLDRWNERARQEGITHRR